jgi:secernin
MCDTFVALAPATADGSVVFAKNSDRPRGEAQGVYLYPGGRHAPGATVRCTYLEIPQVAVTHAVVVSRIDWMWGAEMGANDQGVVVGNEAVWTTEPLGPPALLGMDLVRLALERGATAYQALSVITVLLDAHGQGGACAENDPGFAYHNSFLIADGGEAWVLETAGRHWAAERIGSGVRNISNGLTLRTRFDLASPGLSDHARARGLWDGSTPFDFAAAFSPGPADPGPESRQACGARRLAAGHGRITPETMMAILADHDGGICMHGAFETTASMVSRIGPGGASGTSGARGDGGGAAEHWFTGRPHPCRSRFERVAFPHPAVEASREPVPT